jgi:hypothetical protein
MGGKHGFIVAVVLFEADHGAGHRETELLGGGVVGARAAESVFMEYTGVRDPMAGWGGVH